MTRREARHMPWALKVVAAAGLWAGLALPAAAAELRMVNWADYTAPEMLAKFRAETGHSVTVVTVSSYEEMLARLRDPGGFDLAVPSEYTVPALIRDGQLDRIEAHRLPGFANIAESWRRQYYDPGNDYSIPWHWGTTSFVVDTEMLARLAPDREIDTLALVFDPPPDMPVGMVDDGDDVVTMALRYLGLPRCSGDDADLAKVEALLLRRAGKIAIFDADNPIDWLVEMTTPVSMAWNGDALRAREQRPTLRYAYPREGVTVWTDTLVVPRNAPNRAAALDFLSFMLQPENAALQSNYSGYANAIHGSDAFLAEELLTSPEIIIPPRAKLEFLQACDDATYGRYRRIWSKVKQAQEKQSGTGN